MSRVYLTGSLPGTDVGMQETPTGVQDRLLLYCASENAGQRGLSGPCLKMLRFFVKDRCTSTRCLFWTKQCVIVSWHILVLREPNLLLCVAKCQPAWQILIIPLLQAVVPAHLFLLLRNPSFWPVGTVLVLACAGPGRSGAHFCFWRSLCNYWRGVGGGGGVYNHARRIKLLVWSPCLEQGLLKKRSFFRHGPDMPRWPAFQTCRPTENPSFCFGEGSPKHTRGQRHHLAIL